MSAKPGRLQSGFTSGELAPELYERTSLTYFATGAALMENVVPIPQGGFTLADGLRHIGQVANEASRLQEFSPANGTVYDIVFAPGNAQIWSATAALANVAIGALTAGMLPTLSFAQRLDTLLIFEKNLATKRLKHAGPTSWSVDDAPFENVFTYDYGGPIGGGAYTNGVASQWEVVFDGTDKATIITQGTETRLTAQGGQTEYVDQIYGFDQFAKAMQMQLALQPGILNVQVSVKPAATTTLIVSFELAVGGTLPTTLAAEVRATTPGSAAISKLQEYSAGIQPAIFEVAYTGFVAAELSSASVVQFTVAGQKTSAVKIRQSYSRLNDDVFHAIANLPNINAGLNVTTISSDTIRIEFGGDDNLRGTWAVSGEILNKADAYALATETRVGVRPGEPVFSNDRGWPATGVFYGQRLLMGGLKSLPNSWCMSAIADYFNFDDRITSADGPALVPMDAAGGEAIERIIAGRNILLFTTRAEYWLAERALKRTEAPNHVQSSTRGTKPGTPIVQSEGAAIFCQSNGGVLAEFRYTDLEGNYISNDVSLLATHLVRDVSDIAVQQARASGNGNLINIVSGQTGLCRSIVMLREQKITGFARRATQGQFRACSVNGRNEAMFLIDRPTGRMLERAETGLLLDEAHFFNGAPTTVINGLARINGRQVWCIAGDRVLGPFTVSGGAIVLESPVSAGYVGTWIAPRVKTLPPPRDIGPNIVLKKRARLHSVQISVLDTTSIAIQTNDGTVQDIDLMRYGDLADVPELQRGVTGTLKVRGLTGYRDEPQLTITQVRPGRLTVRAVTLELDL